MKQIVLLFVVSLISTHRIEAFQETTSPPASLWDVKSLRRAPKVTIIEEFKTFTALMYEGEPYLGKPTRVFAYLARPEKVDGKLPAMVLVHGGTGAAFPEWAELWAKRGYVALAMDVTGQGRDRKHMPDGAPDNLNTTTFGDIPLKDSWTYHAVADIMLGVSLLANRDDVDPNKIGITGISWGGYLTCIVAGVDERLKVAIPVYGCGFLDDNSWWRPIFLKMAPEQRAKWRHYLDPASHIAQAKMPMLFVNGTNDFAYPLDSYQKSYRLAKDRNTCVTVNMPHGHAQGWAPVEIGLFADQHLRGGKPLPFIGKIERRGNRIEAAVRAETPIVAAAIHFTDDLGHWNRRKWQTKPAVVGKNVIVADLPDQRPLVWFMTATDDRKASVSSEHEILADPPILAIANAGGKIVRDETAPDQVSVDLDSRNIGDGDLKNLASVKNLTKAYLSATKVTDAGIPELAKLSDLQTLDLRGDRVTGKSMKSLAGLTKLQTLYLSDTDVNDAGLGEIAALPNIEILNLRGDNVTDHGLPSIATMKQLKTLNLTSTKITDAGVARLAPLQKLESLYLNNTAVTDASLSTVAGFRKLQTLNLRGDNVTDAGLKKLPGLKDLRHVYLPGTKITDAGLAELLPLKELQTLNLDATAISDGGVKSLAAFDRLETLHLNGTKLTDAGLKSLATMTQLRWLDVGQTGVSDAGVRELTKALPKCKVER